LNNLHWLSVTFFVLLVPLLLIRLPEAPFSWYDEGLNLNAAQTLADEGVYGLTTGDGIRYADPAIQTGPPLIALISVITKLFGDSLFAVRLSIVIIGIIALASLYALAYRLYGRFAALLAVVFIVVLPPLDTTSTFIMLTRQFLGEVPAVLCISLGFHILLTAENRWQRWGVVGLCWGIAIILKSQVLVVLSVSVGLWTVYRLLSRKEDGLYWLLLAASMVILYGCDTLWRTQMAGAAVESNLAILREGIRIHILPFRIYRNLRDDGVLLRLGISMLALGGLWAARHRVPRIPIIASPTTAKFRAENFMSFFVILWMIWYSAISIGWTRYAFVGLIFTLVILAGVVTAVLKHYRFSLGTPTRALLVGVALVAAYGFNLGVLTKTQGDNFFQMVSDLKTHISPTARIVSMEWAMDNFVPQQFVYPTTHTINVITENAFIRRNRNYGFNSLTACPEYILLGSLTLDRTLMRSALELAEPDAVYEHGIYQLYTVNPLLLPASCRAKTSASAAES